MTIGKIIKQGLAGLVLTGALALGGCQDKSEYKTGKVVKEGGSVYASRLVESSGAMFGNESVKVGESTYLLKVQCDDGIYTMSITPSGKRTLEAIEFAIEEGTTVKFLAKKRNAGQEFDNFGADRIGSVSASDIEVLGK